MTGICSALAGRGVLVTRPRAQAAALGAAIRAAGGDPLLLPLIDIEALEDKQAVAAAAGRLDALALAIFVSANAVAHALDVMLPLHPWPAALPAATVGEQSAQALRARGIPRVIVPHGRSDSEALLALPELSAAVLSGRQVLIFRGDGGRELLGDTLRERGASVDHVTCYRRRAPTEGAAMLHEAVMAGRLHALTLTSSEAVRNLRALAMPDCFERLCRLPLFVPHARIVEQAVEQGFTRVIETAASDAGLMAGLIDYFSQHVSTEST
ncbi:MAG: uroporphyrinogen-III synthase [Methyloversatilis sp. 12-65-5]|nr:MAG: uroporphyrinogen-III synthase [Methyloversatilis sp. 12-65-5]